MQSKTALRQTALTSRQQAHKAGADFAPDIVASLARHIKACNIKAFHLASYIACGSEIDASPLLAAVGPSMGVATKICLPVCLPDDDMLRFRQWRQGDALTDDAMGMRAPLAHVGDCEPDIVLLPVVAFDKSGARLGRGGGFYDRALAALRTKQKILAIGVAYDAQQLDKCPMQSHDQRLDMVVTPTRVLDCMKK